MKVFDAINASERRWSDFPNFSNKILDKEGQSGWWFSTSSLSACELLLSQLYKKLSRRGRICREQPATDVRQGKKIKKSYFLNPLYINYCPICGNKNSVCTEGFRVGVIPKMHAANRETAFRWYGWNFWVPDEIIHHHDLNCWMESLMPSKYQPPWLWPDCLLHWVL